MESLLQRGKELGFGKEAIHDVLGMGRPLSQLAWVSSQDLGHLAQKTAMETMEGGRVVEYECYDSEWRPQGRGTIQLEKWDEPERWLLTGRHGPSSDGYYSHYVKEVGESNFLFHICDGEAKKCKVKKIRGDHRELIHIDRWRLMTPETMIGTGYLADWGKQLGMDLLEQKASEALPKPAEAGTGLDAALALAAKGGDGPGERDEKKKKRVRSPSVEREGGRRRSPVRKEKSASMDDFLAEKVRERKKERDASDSKKKRKKKTKSKVKKRKSSSREGSTSSSSGSSSFHCSPARGGKDLWRLAQKKPGQLTRLALNEMTRYLADRQEAGDMDLMGPKWKGQRVLAYLNQIMLVTHPPSKIGIRTVRELQTLAISLD